MEKSDPVGAGGRHAASTASIIATLDHESADDE